MNKIITAIMFAFATTSFAADVAPVTSAAPVVAAAPAKTEVKKVKKSKIKAAPKKVEAAK